MELKSNLNLTNILLLVIALGVWTTVFQNAGFGSKKVEISNPVAVYGNVSAQVAGKVEVSNEIMVDLRHINGWHAANFYSYTLDGKEYHALGTKDVK